MGGNVLRSGPWTPVLINLAIFGSLPSPIQGLIKSKVAPSHPTMKTFDISFRFLYDSGFLLESLKFLPRSFGRYG